MTRISKFVFSFLVLTLFTRIGMACELVGSYVLQWDETHGDQPLSELRFDVVPAGAEPRPVLEGTQAIAATDCRMEAEGDRSRYLQPFDRGMYLALGWSAPHDSAQLSCYWNDIFFICRNPSRLSLSFDCPSQFDSETLSYETALLCSVRRTEQETFLKKQVKFSNTKTYFGAAGSTGIFSLERVNK